MGSFQKYQYLVELFEQLLKLLGRKNERELRKEVVC
jgi:hypothetical protein